MHVSSWIGPFYSQIVICLSTWSCNIACTSEWRVGITIIRQACNLTLGTDWANPNTCTIIHIGLLDHTTFVEIVERLGAVGHTKVAQVAAAFKRGPRGSRTVQSIPRAAHTNAVAEAVRHCRDHARHWRGTSYGMIPVSLDNTLVPLQQRKRSREKLEQNQERENRREQHTIHSLCHCSSWDFDC